MSERWITTAEALGLSDEESAVLVEAVVGEIRRQFQARLSLASWLHPSLDDRVLDQFDEAVLFVTDPEAWERWRDECARNQETDASQL